MEEQFYATPLTLGRFGGCIEAAKKRWKKKNGLTA